MWSFHTNAFELSQGNSLREVPLSTWRFVHEPRGSGSKAKAISLFYYQAAEVIVTSTTFYWLLASQNPTQNQEGNQALQFSKKMARFQNSMWHYYGFLGKYNHRQAEMSMQIEMLESTECQSVECVCVYIYIYMSTCASVLSRFSCARLFVALWTVAHQAPPSSRGSFPGIRPQSHVSCIDRRVLYHQRYLGSPRTYVSTYICYTRTYTHTYNRVSQSMACGPLPVVKSPERGLKLRDRNTIHAQ